MKSLWLGCIALACVAATVSGIDARQSDAVLAVDVQTAIEMGNRAYLAALEHRDAHAFAALFADDAVSLPPNGPEVRGRAQIEASITAAFTRVTFLDGSTHTLEMHIFGDSAVEVGTYRFAILTDGVASQLHGRYLTIWHRENGKWMIEIDSSQPGALSPDPGSTPMPAPQTSDTPQANE
jgi:uncharacterized protein (TIGR02246 family)